MWNPEVDYCVRKSLQLDPNVIKNKSISHVHIPFV